MASDFLRSLARRRDRLLGLVHEFNGRPARYMHPSWRERLLGESPLVETLLASPRGERRLSELVLTRLELADAPFFDFEEPDRRLALLDGPTLERTLFLAGAAIHAPAVAKRIDRESVRQARRVLGDDGYDFVLRRARPLVGWEETPFALPDPFADLAEAVRQAGRRCLAACLGGEPEPLRRRLLLKLPASEVQDDQSAEAPAEEKKLAGRILRKILLKEAAPGWVPLFS